MTKKKTVFSNHSKTVIQVTVELNVRKELLKNGVPFPSLTPSWDFVRKMTCKVDKKEWDVPPSELLISDAEIRQRIYSPDELEVGDVVYATRPFSNCLPSCVVSWLSYAHVGVVTDNCEDGPGPRTTERLLISHYVKDHPPETEVEDKAKGHYVKTSLKDYISAGQGKKNRGLYRGIFVRAIVS